MPFTAKLYFSGLGLALFHSSEHRSRKPNRVELWTLRAYSHPGSEHLPRFSFELRDVAKPRNVDALNVRSTPEASMIIDKAIDGQILELKALGADAEFDVKWDDPNAVKPSSSDKEDAIDWLPPLENLGLSNFILPENDPQHNVYSSALILPPGQIRSRRFVFGKLANGPVRSLWSMPTGAGRMIADQLVWSRSGLESLSIKIRDFDNAIRNYVFDAEMRQLEGEDAVISLALTNFPRVAKTGRFGPLSHVHMYGILSGHAHHDIIFHLEEGANEVTGGGACPPVRGERIG